MQSAEIVIIGGGLIGLACAYQLTQAGHQVVLLEKADEVGTQLSDHVGIIHSAIHSRPNSLAAHHVRYGNGMLHTFCRQESIPLRCGNQLFVASDAADAANLAHLKQQGLMNGVRCHEISAETIRDIEPYATGVAGLIVEDVPIVNFKQVAQRLALRIEMAGGIIQTRQSVIGLQSQLGGVFVKTANTLYLAHHVINATGAAAPRLAARAGHRSPSTIVPFRGEYMRLKPLFAHQCTHLIFPVPDQALPFLGIHLAHVGAGEVLCGPNAILAGALRQRRKGQINLRTSVSQLLSPPVRKLSRRYLQTALWEQRRSWSRSLFALTLQRMVPTIEKPQLERIAGGTQGFAITSDGRFVNDFVIESAEHITHILSTPNFGATACLSIGQSMVEWVQGTG